MKLQSSAVELLLVQHEQIYGTQPNKFKMSMSFRQYMVMYGISNFEYLIDKIGQLIYGYDGYRIAFLNATKNLQAIFTAFEHRAGN